MVAMNYALTEQEVINAYNKVNSVDFLITAIRNSIINHTTLQYEISKGKE